MGGDSRAFGFPVRCVRAFTAAWREGVPLFGQVLGPGFRRGVAVVRSVVSPSRRPASGCRYYTSGALRVVGADGGLWSGSPVASGFVNAGNLNISTSYVYPLTGALRASGLPVRCVRAFVTAWKKRCLMMKKYVGYEHNVIELFPNRVLE